MRAVVVALLLLCVVAAIAGAKEARAAFPVVGGPSAAGVPEIQELTELTLLSYAAYCIEGVAVSQWGCYWCTQNGAPKVNVTTMFSNDGVWQAWGFVGTTVLSSSSKAAIAGIPVAVVSFRGSTTLDNWETDLDFIPIPYPEAPGALVHRGFLESWSSVRDEVVAAVKQLTAQKVSRVVVTGHSLGAALAQLAAVDLVMAGIPVDLIDFGQPRVGNAAFAAFANKVLGGQSYRVVNEADPVPHVPLEIMDYLHAPREIWFAKNISASPILCSATNGEDPTCSDSLSADQFVLGVMDHVHYMGISLHSGDTKGCPSHCVISGRC